MDAWWISLFICIGSIIFLITAYPETYRPILKFVAPGVVVTFQVTVCGIIGALIIGLFAGLGRNLKISCYQSYCFNLYRNCTRYSFACANNDFLFWFERIFYLFAGDKLLFHLP